jgi:hypothetical protein
LVAISERRWTICKVEGSSISGYCDPLSSGKTASIREMLAGQGHLGLQKRNHMMLMQRADQLARECGLPAPSGAVLRAKASPFGDLTTARFIAVDDLRVAQLQGEFLRIGAAVCRLSASWRGRVLRRSNAGRSNRRAPHRSCASRGLSLAFAV